MDDGIVQLTNLVQITSHEPGELDTSITDDLKSWSDRSSDPLSVEKPEEPEEPEAPKEPKEPIEDVPIEEATPWPGEERPYYTEKKAEKKARKLKKKNNFELNQWQ
jgi:hypothetical protein